VFPESIALHNKKRNCRFNIGEFALKIHNHGPFVADCPPVKKTIIIHRVLTGLLVVFFGLGSIPPKKIPSPPLKKICVVK